MFGTNIATKVTSALDDGVVHLCIPHGFDQLIVARMSQLFVQLCHHRKSLFAVTLHELLFFLGDSGSLCGLLGLLIHIDILGDEDLKNFTLSPATFHGGHNGIGCTLHESRFVVLHLFQTATLAIHVDVVIAGTCARKVEGLIGFIIIRSQSGRLLHLSDIVALFVIVAQSSLASVAHGVIAVVNAVQCFGVPRSGMMWLFNCKARVDVVADVTGFLDHHKV